MQSRTLCRVHAAGATVKQTVLLPCQDKAHISMDEYTQRAGFNMHKFRLFTAGQWRGTILSEDKPRLNARLGSVSRTHNLICSVPIFRRKCCLYFQSGYFRARLFNVPVGGERRMALMTE